MNVEPVILLSAAASLLIRVGLALHAAGQSRSKNAVSAIFRAIADLCGASLAFWAVGAAIFHGRLDYLFGWRESLSAGDFYILGTLLIGTGIMGGVLAERSRFVLHLTATMLLAGIVLPLSSRWVWYGWINQMYGHAFGTSSFWNDVAGASAIHFPAALCAITAVLLLGPRYGKYNHDGSSNAIPGHSVPMACIGVLFMLVGWFPYVLVHHSWTFGSTAAGNILLAAAAGGMAAMSFGRFRYGKPDIYLTCSGLLAGLVAITGVGGMVSTLSAVIIGAVAGLLVPYMTLQLDLRLKIDDPTGAIAVHGVGGLWGSLAVPLFIYIPSFDIRMKLLGIQCIGLLAIAVLSILSSLILFGLLKQTIGIRSREADEYDGLDLAEHDINAYPDFQQNMIKSYHLREA